MAKILVLGSSGFLGCNICNWLMLHTNHNIVGIDDMSVFEDIRNMQPVMNSKRFNFYLSDARNSDHLEKIIRIEKPNYIINVVSSINLVEVSISLEKAISKHVIEKIVNVGSIYGSEALDISKSCKYPAINVVFPKLYGPRQHGVATVPNIIFKTLKGISNDNCTYNGVVFSWMYIRDVFDILCILLRQGRPGTTYFVSSKDDFSDFDIQNKALAIMGASPLITELASKRPTNYYINNDNCSVIDICELCGWRTSFNFDEAFEHTMSWYNVNRWAFKEIEKHEFV